MSQWWEHDWSNLGWFNLEWFSGEESPSIADAGSALEGAVQISVEVQGVGDACSGTETVAVVKTFQTPPRPPGRDPSHGGGDSGIGVSAGSFRWQPSGRPARLQPAGAAEKKFATALLTKDPNGPFQKAAKQLPQKTLAPPKLPSQESKYRTCIQTLRERVTRLEERIRSLKAEQSAMVPKQFLVSAQAELEKAQAEIERLSEALEALAAEKESLRISLKSAHEALAEIHATIPWFGAAAVSAGLSAFIPARYPGLKLMLGLAAAGLGMVGIVKIFIATDLFA